MKKKKKKQKQTELVWKPSEYKLSPIEGRIVLEIDEAGSGGIASLVDVIRCEGLADTDQLLPKFAAAIERLLQKKLITLSKDEKWGHETVAVSLDKTEIATILQYLSECSTTEW